MVNNPVVVDSTPVLILDEATSHADPESEALIQDALSALARRRTVLVIAHRLASISGADQIVVLDQGRVLERSEPVAHNAEGLDRPGRAV